MKTAFIFQPVGGASLAKLGVDQPENPFCTDEYVKATEMLGHEAWIVGTRYGSKVQNAAVALLRRGRLSATLEFVSLPQEASKQEFWEVVYGECRSLKITDLIAGTFASTPFHLPNLAGESSRTSRTEYLVSTDQGNFERRLSYNHRRNLRKAQMAKLVIRRGSAEGDWLREHGRLMNHSLARRASRGESVPAQGTNLEEHAAYLRAGAGELFQAMQDNEVVSSILVLRSPQGAYYHSAGTSSSGLSVGASHFLIGSICRELASERVPIFNLGGAPNGSSLARFKAGFGAAEIALSACTCHLGAKWISTIQSAINLARADRQQLWKMIIGRWHRIATSGNAN
jgi:hypothetical protein